jgi:hypothetical protein
MLDDLCCGLIPEDLMLPTASDHALNLIRDQAMLISAQDQLRVELKGIKADLVQAILRSCITAMLGLFNVFLNRELTCTWNQASILVTASEGQGTSCARKI